MSEPTPYDAELLDQVLAAVANTLRRDLLLRLKDGPLTAGELASGAGVSMPSMSRHLRILEEAGLIVRLKRGRNHIIQLQHEPLVHPAEWLRQFVAVEDRASRPVALDTPDARRDPAASVPDLSPTDALEMPDESDAPASDDTRRDGESGSEPDLTPDGLSSILEQLRGRR